MVSVNNRNLLITIAVAVVLLFVGVIFIDMNLWFGYTDSAILYLASIVGAGFYWMGSNQNQ